MKVFVAVLALASVASAGLIAAPAATVLAAPTIHRVPSLDSAVIKSDRIGGNFAYSVAEAHAHAISTPIIQHVAQPVAVSYSVPQVAVARTVVAAPQVLAAPQVIAAAPQVAVARTVVAAPQLIAGVQTIGAPANTVLLK